MPSSRSTLLIFIVFVLGISYVHSIPPKFLKKLTTISRTTRLYDPNFGFEHYWPGGDWFYLGKTIVPTTTGKPGVKNTYPPQVCNDDCPEMYTNISEVCVVGVEESRASLQEYKTLKSYCTFLVESNPKCAYSGWKEIKLSFVHVGPCLQNYVGQYSTPRPGPAHDKYGKTFPGHYTPDVFEMGPKNRVEKFMKKFYNEKEWTKYYPGKPLTFDLFKNIGGTPETPDSS